MREESVISDWVGIVLRFSDKQFELIFRIKRHVVDGIFNNLVHYDTFWTKFVCGAEKATISPFVKFLCAMKMICYGVSASASSITSNG
jgi:hypothetical protein